MTSLNPVYNVGWQIEEQLNEHYELRKGQARRRAIDLLAQVGIPRPELVFGDHGFAGAAVSRGIPVIAFMDTNDTAIAIARARGWDITLIPLDDGRRPDAYDVIAEMFEQELRAGTQST